MSALIQHACMQDHAKVIERVRTHPHEARVKNKFNYNTLHILAYSDAPLDVVKEVFLAYPAACKQRTKNFSRTPLDEAIHAGSSKALIGFLRNPAFYDDGDGESDNDVGIGNEQQTSEKRMESSNQSKNSHKKSKFEENLVGNLTRRVNTMSRQRQSNTSPPCGSTVLAKTSHVMKSENESLEERLSKAEAMMATSNDPSSLDKLGAELAEMQRKTNEMKTMNTAFLQQVSRTTSTGGADHTPLNTTNEVGATQMHSSHSHSRRVEMDQRKCARLLDGMRRKRRSRSHFEMEDSKHENGYSSRSMSGNEMSERHNGTRSINNMHREHKPNWEILMEQMKNEIKVELTLELRKEQTHTLMDLQHEMRKQLKHELRIELKNELMQEVAIEIAQEVEYRMKDSENILEDRMSGVLQEVMQRRVAHLQSLSRNRRKEREIEKNDFTRIARSRKAEIVEEEHNRISSLPMNHMDNPENSAHHDKKITDCEDHDEKLDNFISHNENLNDSGNTDKKFDDGDSYEEKLNDSEDHNRKLNDSESNDEDLDDCNHHDERIGDDDYIYRQPSLSTLDIPLDC
eukprot:CAMPEP_0194421128 /NCGR_PEP_ID=MMETSP0176-20130528/20361_1 /TAXON_ID=216777 /ORGANISM="Proboscia alata, Strain PI-D3" /LENGTH=571 /DNA_ID=CAMNT_0039229075 /DNA_START=56 /DNA_END=1771 /DNA_ORIENTATION=+